QKILFAGHYDKYWYGFQDDCAAIGLVYAVAKAMVDSGYEPENDMYFIAHGAEEWGVTDSVYDWTTGAWGMCDDEGMANDVLALNNFELPAFDVGKKLTVRCVPEFSTLSKAILNDNIVVTAGDEGILYKTVDTSTMEDGITYREYGAPYFLNGFEGTDFMCDNYHTKADNADTYSETVFNTNINWCGAYAIYIDNHPALPLDFTVTAKRINKGYHSEYATEAGIDPVDYQAAVETFKDAGKAVNAKVDEINAKYAEAVANGDKKAAEAARAEGTELNKTTLEAFQKVQDDFLKVTDFGADYGHTTENLNVEVIDGITAMLDAGEGPAWGEDGDGFGDLICSLNAAIDYNYCNYSKAVADDELADHTQEYYADKDQAMWGWNHMPVYAKTGEMSAKLFTVEDISELSKDDIKSLKEGFAKAREEQIGAIGDWSKKEIESLKALAEMLK
ncbi:MAG: M28 family peptidase, partial [Clostridia bacterium]|nr:M28 family peptidase [Clostridia bacterium]